MPIVPELILEQVINGLLVGSFYIILSLGLSLIFSLGGVVNLAHGAFYAIGAYLAVSVGRAWGFAAGCSRRFVSGFFAAAASICSRWRHSAPRLPRDCLPKAGTCRGSFYGMRKEF